MSAPTPAGPQPEGPRLQPPDVGRPSPALIARADRGYARFLAVQAPNVSTGAHDQDGAAGPPMSDTHNVLYDPQDLTGAALPLDRKLHKRLVKAVLGWDGTPGLPPAELLQIVLQLTGTAHAVAADVRRAADLLPEDHAARALADVVLEEAAQRLSVPPKGTARCAQGHARLVRALYERLDRLARVAPQWLCK